MTADDPETRLATHGTVPQGRAPHDVVAPTGRRRRGGRVGGRGQRGIGGTVAAAVHDALNPEEEPSP